MKTSIQNKVNNSIAHSSSASIKEGKNLSVESSRSNEDSLLKAIRSPEEAAVFMAELDAVIKVAQSK